MGTLDTLPVIESIPDPEAIRNRLAQIAREQLLLRGLLKVAQRKREAIERERAQQVGRTADV
jgi:hypothetical protein